MASGGFRPGAGRKKGSKDQKPRKTGKESDEKKKLRAMLAYDKKAKAKFYQEFLVRVSKGETLSLSEKKMMDKLAVELAEGLNEEEKAEAKAENLDPLTYMLKVMNDPNEDKEMRARMAIAAAPFVHARKGEGKGKKDEQEERAKKAGSGKFAPGKSPISLVK